jgi:hypothetical protein
MNYIKRLQGDIAERDTALSEIDEDVSQLVAYLTSDKFACGSDLDGYVNINDVLGRLQNVRLATMVRG